MAVVGTVTFESTFVDKYLKWINRRLILTNRTPINSFQLLCEGVAPTAGQIDTDHANLMPDILLYVKHKIGVEIILVPIVKLCIINSIRSSTLPIVCSIVGLLWGELRLRPLWIKLVWCSF